MTSERVRAVTRVLVANRGEIARRIVRTCHATGVETVAVFSDADRGAPHVDEATLAVAIGGRTAAESYLDPDRLLDAARRSGADAVHPGYGFLSEDPDFAQAVLDAGLVWIGPPPDAMRAMARKVEAKRVAAAAGVPLVPGAELDADVSDEALVTAAAGVGYPVLVKASAGGGGRGMRVVTAADELAAAVAAARREAQASFGDATVFLERYLSRGRHVEVQVFGDAHGEVVHLFERECSVQRRHQKVVEESPSPGTTPATLEAMCAAAVALARAIGYVGAGTVEFLVAGEGDAQEFFFLEMNTRLQVEHPVTELVTGLDLVAWQLAVARGEPLPLRQHEIGRRGHAIEARLYAEDTARGFLPSTGRLLSWDLDDDGGDWLRVDSGYEQGATVSEHYDALLAKVVAHGDDRTDVARSLAEYLRGTSVVGVTTNALMLAAVLDHPAFLDGATTTAFLDEHPEVLAPQAPADVLDLHLLAAAAALFGLGGDAAGEGWRTVAGVPETLRVGYRRGERDVVAVLGRAWTRDGATLLVAADADELDVDGARVDPHAAQTIAAMAGPVGPVRSHRAVRLDPLGPRADDGFAAHRLEVDGVRRTVDLRHDPADPAESVAVDAEGWVTTFSVLPLGAAGGHEAGASDPTTPVPGTVTHVAVEVGSTVAAGEPLVVLEAMKMEHTVRAGADGVVTAVHVRVGQSVDAHVVVATVEPS
ncbi:MAG: ATP-grasp domain-containing protein [Frankiales bacterium]|nr:ATP-grasp domain-containing protein [Frankiales bacterium]